MKGAFANVLSVCTTLNRSGAEVPLDESLRERLKSYYRDKGTEGFRLLALATKRVSAQERYAPDDETGMSLEGFLLFFDPPKAQAAQTVRELAGRGVRVKVITGDNRYVAAHVAGTIGLDPKAMLTGEAIAGLRDESLWHLAARTDAVRRGRSATEGADRAGAAAAAAVRRSVSRRWHQRYARDARRRHEHLCRSRRWMLRSATADWCSLTTDSSRYSSRYRRRSPHVRQHPQVHFRYEQRQASATW